MQPDSDAQSFVQVDVVVPPWAEGYELDVNDGKHLTGFFEAYFIILIRFALSVEQWIDEFSEDKLRRVRRELESGDVIDAVFTVSRIVGVDSSRKPKDSSNPIQLKLRLHSRSAFIRP